MCTENTGKTTPRAIEDASESGEEQATEQLVVMRLADEDYGVEITHVREIIRMQNITEVPQAPAGVEGIINLRGSVIPVVDLRQRFGIRTSDNSAETRIVVVDAQEQTVGLVVDAVTEVITVSTSLIEPVGNLAAAAVSSDLRGIVNLPEKLIILVGLESLLGSVSGIDSDEVAAAA
jgi:purine-binding chemotaxis protein CheW